ncbi:MAG: O-antigen ligase family protein [Chloroflexi bacterium]|nr:O-antigen ligase family protein [Chloroflexota bacterium]
MPTLHPPPSNPLARIAQFLLRRRWLILLLASPFLLFPSPSTAPMLLIVPGLGLFFWITGAKPFTRTPLNPAILVLSAMMLVSLWMTYDVAISLPKIAGVILGVGAFDCVASYGARARGWWIGLAAFLIVGLGVAFAGLIGTQWAIKFDRLIPFTDQFEPRLTGLPGVEKGISPNEVAGALLWVIPVCSALALIGLMQLKNRTAPRRWLAPLNLLVWEATIFIVLVFLLCQSRTAYLALALTVLVGVFGLTWHQRRWRVGAMLALGILGALVAWSYQADPATRDASGNLQIAGSSMSFDTFNGRDQIWARAWIGIAQYPLTGMGMNTFRYRMTELDPQHPIYAGRDIAHAHNELLQAALDLGVPGLLALIGMYVIAFALLRRVWTRAAETRAPDFILRDARARRWLVLGLGGGLFAHLVYGMTDAVALGAKPGILFWMLLGLIAGLDCHSDHCHSERSAESPRIAGDPARSLP